MALKNLLHSSLEHCDIHLTETFHVYTENRKKILIVFFSRRRPDNKNVKHKTWNTINVTTLHPARFMYNFPV